jgi:PAS domain S-box-containing protein
MLIEALLILAILAGTGILAFKGYLPTPYIMMPPLLWAAARFQLRGAAVALALIVVIEALYARTATEALAGQPELVRDRIVNLQAFLGISAISALVVAALSLQYKQALRSLTAANTGLEARIAERTADLRESNAQLRLSLAAAKMTAWRYSPQTGEVALTENAAEVLELPEHGAITKADQGYALVHPEDVERHRALVARALRDGGNYFSQYRHARDGKIIWLEEHGQAVAGSSGQVTGLVGVTTNITERKRVEEALRRSEAEFRAISNAAPALVWVCSATGDAIYMNDRWHEYTGQSQDEARGFGWSNAMHPEDNERILPYWQRCRETGETYQGEVRYRRHDGEYRWHAFRALPQRGANGRIEKWFGVSIDVHEAKQTRDALIDAQRFNQGLIDAAPTLLYIYDLVENRNVFISPQIETIIGMSMEEIAGAGPALLANLFHPEDLPRIGVHHQGLRERPGDGPREIEYRMRHKDGSWRWLLSRDIVYETDMHGLGRRILGSAQDVTKLKQTRDALLDSERRLELASEAGRLGVHEFDVARGRSLWSSSLWHLLGLEGEGEVPFEMVLTTIYPDDRERVRAEMNGIVRRPGPYEMEFRIRRPDGTVLWVIDRGEAVGPVDEATGGVALVRGTILDITERKRNEEHQRMLMNELNHRVKNTLATIQSMAMQTLRTSPDLSEARERFEARLMALSKAHDVLTREKWEGAPLADIVERAIAPYRGEGEARFSVKGPNIRVSPRMSLALAMALHELCTNAVKYGALSNDKGKVSFAWSVSKGRPAPVLKLLWREWGGPPVTPPSRKGFGSRLIERGLAGDLGGEVKLAYAKSGVTCTITAPLERGP